ncbi:MAG TPA: beta-ketoacyl synthase chain length factor [Cyclobacteriaceae bacterium]
MKLSRYYINGVGIVSPQRTFDNAEFLNEITHYHENVLHCVLPEFKDYINPIQLRRLSRMLRVGLSAAVICVRDSGERAPDGIITGTGYGFLHETAKFLEEIYQYNEKQLTPTYFMQSTYNALAGLVALTLKCKGYNNTHVNKGFAFETSMHDAMMHLATNISQNFLVGAFDETDKAQYTIHSQAGYYKTESIDSVELFKHKTIGSLQGEGAAFFSISGTRGENVWCEVADLKMIFCPESGDALRVHVTEFLSANNITTNQVDVLVSGLSGDVKHDEILNMVIQEFNHATDVRFKHLSGEYCTASSFGCWVGASILKKQRIPDVLRFNQVIATSFKTVLIINQYMGRNYSLVLLKSV